MEYHDPLDSDDFDPIQYMNQRFPNESSLEDLDTFVIGIGSKISTLDEEISKAVQHQSSIGQEASKDIISAQESIADLFDKINDIKSKASQSERMVQEICADIKKLDYAKNHLQSSITTLKRLQMLITALKQLEILSRDRNYKEAANYLDVVKQLMTHFDQYAVSIPMIAEMKRVVESVQKDLCDHVHLAFMDLPRLVESVADTDMLDSTSSSSPLGGLAEACLVVDTLGTTFRARLLDDFVQEQLKPYERIFGPDQEHFSLDQIDRRWAWFRRVLKYIETKFSSIFPSHWRLPLRICLEFIERTKQHLVTLLTGLESKNQMDVHMLLKALQSTLRFENETSLKFGMKTDRENQKARENARGGEGEGLVGRSPFNTGEGKGKGGGRGEFESDVTKLKEDEKVMYIPTDHNQLEEQHRKKDPTELYLDNANASLSGSISGVFDSFMNSYVLLERNNLEELLQRLSSEEDTTREGEGSSNSSSGSGSGGHGGSVFGSAMSMFVFIKSSMKRCLALSNGLTFFSLVREFRTSLLQYASMLKSRCPVPINLISTATASGAPQVTFRLSPGQEATICYVVNTAEYCAEVIPQLEELIQKQISINYKEKIDLSNESDAFMDLAAHALKTLSGGLLDRMDQLPFKTMLSIRWSTLNPTGVSEESPYCMQFQTILLDAIPKVRDSLSGAYFNNFCLKLSTDILQRYLDVIFKQRGVSETATQQLLVDTYNLRALLLRLPNLGRDSSPSSSGSSSPVSSTSSSSPPVPAMYTKVISSKLAHIEVVLKLIACPEEVLVERFRLMWPEGQASDLQALMAVKDMKKHMQQNFLETLGLGLNLQSAGVSTATLGSAVSSSLSMSMAATSALSSSARTAVGNISKWSSGGTGGTN